MSEPNAPVEALTLSGSSRCPRCGASVSWQVVLQGDPLSPVDVEMRCNCGEEWAVVLDSAVLIRRADE